MNWGLALTRSLPTISAASHRCGVIALLSLLLAVQTFALASAETANRLAVEARKAWDQAQVEFDPRKRVTLLESVLERLDRIVEDFPDSERAIETIGDKPVAGITRSRVRREMLSATFHPQYCMTDLSLSCTLIQAHALAESLEDANERILAIARVAAAMANHRQIDRALQLISSLPIDHGADRHEDKASAVRMLSAAAQVLQLAGRKEESKRVLRRAVDGLEHVISKSERHQIHWEILSDWMHKAPPDLMEPLLQRAYEMAAPEGSSYAFSFLQQIGMTCTRAWDLGSVQPSNKQLVQFLLCNEMSWKTRSREAVEAFYLCSKAQLENDATHIDRAADVADANLSELTRALIRIRVALAYIQFGLSARASAILDLAIEDAKSASKGQRSLLGVVSALFLAQGNAERAKAVLEQGERIPIREDAERLSVVVIYAILYSRSGKQEAAERSFDQALSEVDSIAEEGFYSLLPWSVVIAAVELDRLEPSQRMIDRFAAWVNRSVEANQAEGSTSKGNEVDEGTRLIRLSTAVVNLTSIAGLYKKIRRQDLSNRVLRTALQTVRQIPLGRAAYDVTGNGGINELTSLRRGYDHVANGYSYTGDLSSALRVAAEYRTRRSKDGESQARPYRIEFKDVTTLLSIVDNAAHARNAL